MLHMFKREECGSLGPSRRRREERSQWDGMRLRHNMSLGSLQKLPSGGGEDVKARLIVFSLQPFALLL